MRARKFLSIFLALLICLGLCLPASLAAGEANLFHNGEFNSSNMSHWWPRGDWNGGQFTYSPTKGKDGTGALVATGNGPGTPDFYAGIYYSHTDLPNVTPWQLSAGRTYTMSADVYVPAGVTGVAVIDIVNGDGTDRPVNESYTARSTVTGEWQTISFTFTAPAFTVWPRVMANALATGKKIIVDNLSLVCTSATETPDFEPPVIPNLDSTMGDNLFVNGTFNKLNVSKWWVRTDWVPMIDATKAILFDYNAEGGVDDTGCFAVAGKDVGDPRFYAGLYYSDLSGEAGAVRLIAGETYYFACDVWRSEGCNANVWLDVDLEDRLEGQSDFAEKNGEWETIGLRFVVAEDNTDLYLRVVTNGLPKGDTVKVDNMQLRIVGQQPTGADQESSGPISSGAALTLNEHVDVPAPETAKPSVLVIVLIAAGIVILVAAAVVVAILLKKKKDRAAKAPEAEAEIPTADAEPSAETDKEEAK